jgi:hypothetical protein
MAQVCYVKTDLQNGFNLMWSLMRQTYFQKTKPGAGGT